VEGGLSVTRAVFEWLIDQGSELPKIVFTQMQNCRMFSIAAAARSDLSGPLIACAPAVGDGTTLLLAKALKGGLR